mgnify:FL=1
MIRLPGLQQVSGSSFTVDLTVPAFRTLSATAATTVTLTMGSVLPGVHYTLKIPAGKFTSSSAGNLTFVGNWNIFPPTSGYSYDPAQDTYIDFQTLADGGSTLVYANVWQKAPPDVTAPTVVSASATGSALTVVYSEAVITTATGGLSLNFTTGTARTITGITSGSGTTTVVYSLSGAVAGTDVATFVVAGSGVQVADASGNAVAAGSTSISFTGSASMPQTASLLAWFNAPRQISDGTSLATRVTNYAPSASHGTAVGSITLSGGAYNMTRSSGDTRITTALTSPTGTYTAMSIVKMSSLPDYSIMWGSGGGDQFSNHITPGDAFEAFHSGGNGNGGSATSYADGNYHVICYSFASGSCSVFVDNMTTAVATFACGNPGGSSLQWGEYQGSDFSVWPGSMKAAAIWNGITLSATERQDAADSMGVA